MLCSSCSKTVRPIVALDIDGTLGDYHSHFVEFLIEYTGMEPGEAVPPYQGVGSFRQWAEFAWGIDTRTFRDAKLAYRQGARKRTMPVYPYAARLCDRVRQLGADLWVTTTRPYLRLDNVDPDTREWLRRQGIDFDGLLYDDRKYQRLGELVDHDRVVAIVDDLPELIEEAAEVFGSSVPIQALTNWNANARVMDIEIPTLYGLDYVKMEVEDRINRWKGQHE